jgi:hypothetical protein
MAAKFDKELLIKHRFWIGLGVCILFVLVVLIMLPNSVGSAVDIKKKEYDGQLKTMQSIGAVKNQSFVDALKRKDGHVEKRKNEVWSEAWKTQADMMTWPPNLEETWSKKYPYFGDPIEVSDRDKFGSEYDYQLYDVVNVCQPIDEKGKGVVQFSGGWNAVLGLERSFVPPPSNEDIWLAQEDLWIKRELLSIIREANDYVARFTEVLPDDPAAKDKKDAKPAPQKDDNPAADAAQDAEKDAKPAPAAKPKMVTDPMHRKYRNYYWELDLNLTRNDKGAYAIGGKIKNIGKARQPLDTDFKVYFDDTQNEDTPFDFIHVARVPMNVDETFVFKDHLLGPDKSIRGIYGVEQVLTWQTGPVKRIDKIELGYPSSRTANRSLKPPIWIPKPEAAAEGDPTATAPEGMPASARFNKGGTGQSGSGSGDQTKSGLNKNRYTDANAQVRHMAIGMAVLVDEDHIHDFLGALANSRLKIQTLQIHWNHSRDKIKPALAEVDPATNTGKKAAGSAQTPRPGANQPSPMGNFPGKRQDMMNMGRGMTGSQTRPPGAPTGGQNKLGSGFGLGSFGPGGFGRQITAGRSAAPGASTTASEEEEPMNLVSLSVYGLATLYERFPPKPESADQTAAAK